VNVLTAVLLRESSGKSIAPLFSDPKPATSFGRQDAFSRGAFTNTEARERTGNFMAESNKRNQKNTSSSPILTFYQLVETLPAEELAVLSRCARSGTKGQPIITSIEVEDSFPFELLPAIRNSISAALP